MRFYYSMDNATSTKEVNKIMLQTELKNQLQLPIYMFMEYYDIDFDELSSLLMSNEHEGDAFEIVDYIVERYNNYVKRMFTHK